MTDLQERERGSVSGHCREEAQEEERLNLNVFRKEV